MLHVWMEQNVLLYGMIAMGILGILCIMAVNRFYNKALYDLRRMTEPKAKWTKEFINEYQTRCSNNQEIVNPEVFIRSQLLKGKVLGISLEKWKQGIGLGAILCFALMMAAVYGSYQYENSPMFRYEYVLAGAGILALLILIRQLLGFGGKEDMVIDGYQDYVENTSTAKRDNSVDFERSKEEAREALIEQVTEGIRQTAASNTKFSHLLSPEEEHIMKEVIRAYLGA